MKVRRLNVVVVEHTLAERLGNGAIEVNVIGTKGAQATLYFRSKASWRQFRKELENSDSTP
jgi:hypothetical protein